MPLFEVCCRNSPTSRKKSTAYAPSPFLTGKGEDNCAPVSPSTSNQKPSIRENNSCHLNCEMSGGEKNQNVRFNEGLLTGSTEMLHATKFYQNCVDQDTESHWMEVYEEHKAGGQTSSSASSATENGQENALVVPKDKFFVGRSTTTMHCPAVAAFSNAASLEKTHSAEPKVDRKFKSHLQRCQEMENINKVEDQG